MKSQGVARALSRSQRASQPIFARYNSTPSDPSSSTSWKPLLPPGESPAYDAALSYLSEHRSKCLAKLEPLRSIKSPTRAQQKEMEALETDAYVNDPAVRAEFREHRGVGQMHRPVIRHLAEKSWKQEGGMDMIMGRVYQNKIVPDLLPDMAPTSPLVLSVTEGKVEPGLTLPSSIFEQKPTITFQPFHHLSEPTSDKAHPEALYTLIALDGDHPEPEQHTFSQRLHYLKTDIPLSLTTGQVNLFGDIGKEVVSWEPPAPPQGSPRHRMVFVLMRQPSTKTDIVPSRTNFNLRKYLDQRGVTPAAVVGINMFRTEWVKEDNEYIERVWREFRGQPVPVYSKARNQEKYVKPLNALDTRIMEIRQRAWEKAMEEYAEVGLAEGVAEAGDSVLNQRELPV